MKHSYLTMLTMCLLPASAQTPLSVNPADFIPPTVIAARSSLTFVVTGQPNDVWFFEIFQHPDFNRHVCAEVRDPGNNTSSTGCSYGDLRRSFATTRAGLYTIRIYPNTSVTQDIIIHGSFGCSGACGAGPSNYPRFGAVSPRNLNASFMGSGIVTPAERFHLYRFYGTTNQVLTPEVVDKDVSSHPCLRVYSPTGVFIVQGCSATTKRETFTATTTGWYYAYFYDLGVDQDLRYDIRLACSPACTQPPLSQGSHFIPITPCRAVDTRDTSSIPARGVRSFTFEACNITTNATAVALNVTLVPGGPFGYLSIWPAGQGQPVVSTMNSLDGRIKANAAFVGLGANKAVSVFVTDTAHVILDVNGYFVPAGTGGALAFYPIAPCRIVDSRTSGGLIPDRGTRRIEASGSCLPIFAQAYSLNVTVVPSGPLGYLTLWPDGPAQPNASTLNALTGTVVANAAVLRAGTGGALNAYVTDRSHLIIDANGYFALPGMPGELAFYPVQPCRIFDTRNSTGAFGGPRFESESTRSFAVPSSSCGIPVTAQAYVSNATVLPAGVFGYLTMWPGALNRPTVSTLNAVDGALTSNAAIVPAGPGGAIQVFASNPGNLLLDISGYFAP